MIRSLLVLFVMLFAGVAEAKPAKFFDWEVNFIEEAAMAATSNGKTIFGEYCNLKAQECHWVLALESTCDTGSEYPVLANTDAGASHITLVCSGILKSSGLYYYVIRGWANLESLIKNSTRIGFAIPLVGDQFRVLRYSLVGLNSATSVLETYVYKNVTPTDPDFSSSGIKDQTL